MRGNPIKDLIGTIHVGTDLETRIIDLEGVQRIARLSISDSADFLAA